MNITNLNRKMSKCFISQLILFVLFWIGLTLGFAQNYENTSNQKVENYLNQILNETGVPGLSATIAVNGIILYSGGVGYAELENHVLSTGSSVHNIASISKMHAVVALMQLVEKGKLNLDEEIQTYVPFFPKKKYPITVRHILTHSSGIRHYKDGEFGEQDIYQKMHYKTLEEGIKVFKDDSLIYKPGTYWAYSSYAYNLTQGIIENISGMSFEEYLRKNVWQPAGLTSTQFDVPNRVVHNRGKGYKRSKGGKIENIDYVDVSYKYAGGGILSSTEDLVKFALAINSGKLLKEKTVKQMYKIQYKTLPAFNDEKHRPIKHSQALGWFMKKDVQGRIFPSHTGSVKGTKSVLINYPELNITVALIGNVSTFHPFEYGEALVQMFLPPINKVGRSN